MSERNQHTDDLAAAIERGAEEVAPAADATVERFDTGVRLRTNIQAGSASQRVNVTSELHARDMGDLALKLDSYRDVLGDQLDWAHRQAREVDSR